MDSITELRPSSMPEAAPLGAENPGLTSTTAISMGYGGEITVTGDHETVQVWDGRWSLVMSEAQARELIATLTKYADACAAPMTASELRDETLLRR
jgi:hypothetical protein